MTDANKVLQIVAVVGAVLSLIAVALVGVHLMGVDDSAAGGSVDGGSAGVAEEADSDGGSADQETGKTAEPKGLKLVGDYRVSGPTTPGFGQAVTDEFMRLYEKDGTAPAKVEATSPTTQITYLMRCVEDGQEYHCTGGNDAHVYVK